MRKYSRTEIKWERLNSKCNLALHFYRRWSLALCLWCVFVFSAHFESCYFQPFGFWAQVNIHSSDEYAIHFHFLPVSCVFFYLHSLILIRSSVLPHSTQTIHLTIVKLSIRRAIGSQLIIYCQWMELKVEQDSKTNRQLSTILYQIESKTKSSEDKEREWKKN